MDAKKALNNFNQGFDFVFIDANKSQYEYYFNESLKLLNENGLIVCDNILFRGEITNDNLINRRHITMVKNLRKIFIIYYKFRRLCNKYNTNRRWY